jgi:hypothetical protein
VAATFKKDPQAKLDYAIDWGRWLAPSDSITTATWTVPAGITKTAESVDGTKAVIWLSGGTVGQTYSVTCHVVTAEGRENDKTVVFLIADR